MNLLAKIYDLFRCMTSSIKARDESKSCNPDVQPSLVISSLVLMCLLSNQQKTQSMDSLK